MVRRRMQAVVFVVIITMALLVSQASAFAHEKKIVRVASIDWCPQLCPNSEDRGYVYDLVQLAFKDSPYSLVIETMPWSRAIKLTREGVTLALLSPARAEAPDLLFPDIPVGAQRMCFFTLSTSAWSYQGDESLKGLRIGIAYDTSIEELNDYVQANTNQFQFQPYSDTYIVSSLRKLKHGRIDTFLFTKNTTIYEINKIGWSKDFRLAGCLSKADIFMAFSSDPAVRAEVMPLLGLFEERMAQFVKDGTVEKVMSTYGLEP